MNSAFRNAAGGNIDRRRPVRFTFDGFSYSGFVGDTVASALLANGVHLLGRSFKYHRPRGITTAGIDEPNALLRVGRSEGRITPNMPATQVEIFDGLVVESQNRWPSLALDFGAVSDWVAPFLPAGFYYKTFMWPVWGWHRIYEPVIRTMAGLGRPPRAADADHYAQTYAHCDVLVIGAGPAGIAAALAAASSGGRVVICDESAMLGGSLLNADPATSYGQMAQAYLSSSLIALSKCDRVTLLPRTTAFGVFAQNFVALSQRVTDHVRRADPALPRERLWQIRAAQLVLATGAIERPMVFANNDRPGIMMASAAHRYLRQYAARPGKRAVLFTNNDAAYGAAIELAAAGVQIAAVADSRMASDGELPHAAREAGIRILNAHSVHSTRGRRRVKSVDLVPCHGGKISRFGCDVLLMSGGYTPTVHLFSQARGSLRFESALGAFVPDGDADGVRAAGACRGVFGAAQAIEDGREAGALAGAASQQQSRQLPVSAGDFAAGAVIAPASPGRAFVDFQNDVTAKDIALAVQEGFQSVEHVKRYTTVGMATDQGKTSNINSLGIVARTRGTTIGQAGLTTFRMPYTPITFATLAGPARGALFDPIRQTPLHEWAESKGAVFEDVALWKRARYFPEIGETMSQAVARECRAVRTSAGIFDASTLGKIDVSGPDAAVFLERMYVNGFCNLPAGRARYGVLLREDGFILDDGVIGRLSADRFHVTTSTGGASRVLAMMEDYLQTEWPDLQVWLTSTTDEWAVISVQGPRAWEIIGSFIGHGNGGPDTFPHMGALEGYICGVDMRLFRVSFTGELGYEINVPSEYAVAVWDALWQIGQPLGLTPYGTEAMHVLRAEKGFIIVGQDTDGTATPDDMGLGWAINNAKGDFVGKRSLARAAMADPSRKQLVGLTSKTMPDVLEEGAQVIDVRAPQKSLGHVTSAYYSWVLQRPIAMAMVSGGRARHGTELAVPMPNRTIRVQIVPPVFYDPSGARLNG